MLAGHDGAPPHLSPHPGLCDHRQRLSMWLVTSPCPWSTRSRRGLKNSASLRCRFHPPLVMVVTALRWLGPKGTGEVRGH